MKKKLILNNKRVKFLCEFGILLVLLGLVSSVISIYFEGKLIKKQNNLIKLEIEEFTIQEWLSDASKLNLRNKMRKFEYELIKDNPKFYIDEKRYNFMMLLWYPVTIDYAIFDIQILNKKNLEKKHNISKIINKNNEVRIFIQSIYDKLDNISYNSDLSDIYFSDIELKKIQEFINDQEKSVLTIINFFNDLNKINDLEKKKIKESILLNSKKSTNTILYAFIIQILVFFVIQFFELTEVPRAKKTHK